jgi:hypothetical protein
MRILQPAAFVAMPELSKLGNAAARITSSIRYRFAAFDYESLNTAVFRSFDGGKQIQMTLVSSCVPFAAPAVFKRS